MAIAVALPGVNDLGRTVTPIFLYMDHFLYRFSTFSDKMKTIYWIEVWIFCKMHHRIPLFLALRLSFICVAVSNASWRVKVPISSKCLFSYLILCITQWTFTKEKYDLDKMQYFLEVLKTFKFAAILVHHSHQSSLVLDWVVTYIKEHAISGLSHLVCFTFVNLT